MVEPTIVPGVARLNEISLPEAVSAMASPTCIGVDAGIGAGVSSPPPQATRPAVMSAMAVDRAVFLKIIGFLL